MRTKTRCISYGIYGICPSDLNNLAEGLYAPPGSLELPLECPVELKENLKNEVVNGGWLLY